MRRRTAGAGQVRKIAEAVLQMAHSIPPEEMDQALNHLAAMTTTNCWWVEYELRDALRQIILTHRHWLQKQQVMVGEPDHPESEAR